MTISRKTYSLFLYLLCIALSVVILVPFAMMFVNSFKDMRESLFSA